MGLGIETTTNPKAFGVWFKDLDRWSVSHYRHIDWSKTEGYVVPIGEVLTLKRIEVSPDIPRQDLPIIEKISFGGRVSITSRKRREGYKGRLFWANPRDFIYSKIRAKQGSFAIIPPEIKQLAVSTEYPVFSVNKEKVDGRYLELVIRSSRFLNLLDGLSHGGSSKTRIPPEEFVRLTIPVPAMPIQHSIVEAWDKHQKDVDNIRKYILDTESQIETDFLADLGLLKRKSIVPPKVFGVWWKDLERWSVMFNQLAGNGLDISNGKYDVVTLGEISTVTYGIQKSPSNRPGQHARPYLRVANVQRGELDLREVKTINVPDAEMATYRLEPGDLLVCEGNSADLVGRPAIWNGEIPNCVHQNHILKVRVNRSIGKPEFVLEYMQTTPARNYFRSRAKFTTNLASINSNDLRGLPLPLPPSIVQNTIISNLAAQRKKIADMKNDIERKLQQARIDVEAMILGEKKVQEV